MIYLSDWYFFFVISIFSYMRYNLLQVNFEIKEKCKNYGYKICNNGRYHCNCRS